MRSTTGSITIPILVSGTETGEVSDRRAEPITLGVPFPRGLLTDPDVLGLTDPRAVPCAVQVRVLDRWPDTSVRWALVDFQAALAAGESAEYVLRTDVAPPASGATIHVRDVDGTIAIDTGAASFRFGGRQTALFSVTSPCVVAPQLDAVDAAGGRSLWRCRAAVVEEAGALRTVVRAEGTITDSRGANEIEVTARWTLFAGSPVVRGAFSVRNPRRAQHRGGIWTLGDPGSILFRKLAIVLGMELGSPPSIACSREPGMAIETMGPFWLYQDSSGGEHWNSTTHVNRDGRVPHQFRGYRVESANGSREGHRATPIVAVSSAGTLLAITMPEFWQNFPKAVDATATSLALQLFPEQFSDLHELQGGEQKTHTFALSFGEDRAAGVPLAWCRSPLFARCRPEWYCESAVVPHLVAAGADEAPAFRAIVDAAVDGPAAFSKKREDIDEYGWRHFGDIYADHEVPYSSDPAPIVSHYNNQYDAVAGFAVQFLSTGREAWWTAMRQLAAHVVDIDIYHTEHDKAAYNGGLFWHTYHYVSAGASTHRSYPRHEKVGGGGPSAEHNYAAGLALHHFLTGDPATRSAAIGLGRWVVNMDDGGKSPFRWIDRGFTGLASASGSPLYHGPGRGAANSIAVLLESHRLSGEAALLEKAEQLVRRCIHPADDIAARDLLNAEQRWFYTVFLEVLGRYLAYKEELGALDATYAHARDSLLHYARWMLEHEYPYLDKPERLEYPTETWAAQDVRKSNVLAYAALYAAPAERDRFLERSRFFYDTSVATLSEWPTRQFTRPVVVMLAAGWVRAGLLRRLATSPSAGVAAAGEPSGPPEPFVPQRVRAVRTVATAAVVALCALGASILWLVR